MTKIHTLQIKHLCIRFAADNGMAIKTLTNDRFIAEDEISVVDVPLDHLYNQLQQGHLVEETLLNETNSKEELC